MLNIERMQLRLFWMGIIILLLTLSVSAREDWQLKKAADGIKVYTKTESGSDYKSFKAEMQLNCRIDDIVEVLKEMNIVNNWVADSKEVKLLKTEGNTQYYYIETSLPWPFNNRDMVYRFQYIAINSDQVKVTVTGLPDYIQTKKGIVRLAKANGYWLLTSIDSGKTAVTYQMHVEPGGLIPAWLANAFIVNVPFSTFRGLRRVVQKSK
ncbi:MAG TPA: START domain-containing protein [Ignavibacteriaceae bacterium]|nr:START domain-containing protein [Ignavibacteriaceae bacterium]